jgi:hypothetical protein
VRFIEPEKRISTRAEPQKQQPWTLVLLLPLLPLLR